MKPKLQARLLSAVIAIIVALAVTWLGGPYYMALILAIVFLAQLEFFKLVRATGALPAKRTTIAISMLLVTVQYVRPEWTNLVLTIGGSVVCFYLLFKTKVATINDIATSILGLFYCAYLPSFWILVRGQGLNIIVLAYVSIWAADIGAYFLGKAFGRTQLSIISPKKTVEGAAFGIGGSMVAAAIGTYWLNWPWWPGPGLVLGFLLGLTSLLGDLTESLMKRNAGVKDSGDLIPGHGGILDRGDSYVFTAPLTFYFVELMRRWLEFQGS